MNDDTFVARRPSLPETAAVFLGTYKRGAILLSMSVLYGDEGIEHRLSDSGAKAVVTDSANRDRIPEGMADTVFVLDGDTCEVQGVGFAGVPIDNRETYFVLRDVVHEVDARGRTELEILGDEPHRWWSVEEIAASTEEFAPRELPAVLPVLLEGPWTGVPRIVT